MVQVGERFEIELDEAPQPGERRARSNRHASVAPVVSTARPDDPSAFAPAPADGEPSDGADPSQRDPNAERRRAIVIGAAVAVGLTLAVTGFALGRSTGTSDDGSGEIAAATSTAAPTTTESPLERRAEALPGVDTVGPERTTTTTTDPAEETVLDLGRPLLPAPLGVDIVGLTTDGRLMELNPDTGVATFTELPRLDDQVAMLAGNTGTLVAAPYNGSVWFIPRNGEPQRWRTPTATGTAFFSAPLPGPDPDSVWLVQQEFTGESRLQLSTLAGDPIRDPIEIPAGWTTMADGTGGVLVFAPGGTYRLGIDGTRRVTSGTVVASGHGGLVVVDCDDGFVCSASLLVHTTGEQRPLDVLDVGALSRGGWVSTYPSVAPDGGAMLTYRFPDEPGAEEGIALLDLTTGLSTVLSQEYLDFWPFAWSTDGRMGVYLDDGKLFYVDRPLRTYLPLHEDLPELHAFTTRPREVPSA